MTLKVLIDIEGWIGAAVILIAYFLISTKRLTGDSLAYQTMNLAGGLLLILNTIYYGAYPSSGVNLVWAGIAVYAIGKKRIAIRNRWHRC